MAVLTEIEKRFGPRLRSLREAAGLTQGELAEAAKLARPFVNRLEVGHQAPSWDVAVRLAGVLGCDVGEFVGEAAPKKSRKNAV